MREGSRVGVYCGSGVSAAHEVLALARSDGAANAISSHGATPVAGALALMLEAALRTAAQR